MKELEQFLLDRAMEHDSPTLLFNLATEYLMAAKTIRPGVTTLAKMVATARTSATALAWEKVAHLLTGQLRSDLDRLLVSDAGLKMTRLAWLIKAATDAGSTSVKTSIDKLTYLRSMDAHTLGGHRCAGGSADRHEAPETPHCARPSCVGVPFTVLAAASVTRVRCGPAAPVGGGAVTCWEPIYPSTG
ncbi:DUF4158 domain-containing protein [Nonomuraea polychroma]|uniref:DUF4158 domain-containing protein n=1 Tax=Nonomuraea polychroma TaxID=46176 RepID=UPI0026C5D078